MFGTILNHSSIQHNPCRFHPPIIESRQVEQKTASTAKIQFEKMYLAKDQRATDIKEYLRGSLAITKDDQHKGIMHILIFLGQFLNAFFTGRKRDNLNLCHAEVILGVKQKPGKEQKLRLAQALGSGFRSPPKIIRRMKSLPALSFTVQSTRN